MKKMAVTIILIVMFLMNCPDKLYCNDEIDWKNTESVQKEMMSEIRFDEIDEYLKETEGTEEIKFSDIVEGLISGEDFDNRKWTELIFTEIFGEVQENKNLLIELLALILVFALLKNFSDVFNSHYITEISFILVYGILMILLMKSFLTVKNILESAIEEIIEFMKMLVPVFGISMAFSAQAASAGGFYTVIYLVVFLIQNILLDIVLPGVLVFVLIQFMNYAVEGEKFSRLSELIELVINWTLKVLLGIIVGMNMIQSMLKPAMDRLKTSTFTKTVSMIPGVGNAFGTVGEIFISSGMLIKNSIGIGGVLVMLFLAINPFVKIAVMTICYKAIAAMAEPVADKRMSGCLNGIYRGSVLIMKSFLLVVLLFFITIAMITAATSWIN